MRKCAWLLLVLSPLTVTANSVGVAPATSPSFCPLLPLLLVSGGHWNMYVSMYVWFVADWLAFLIQINSSVNSGVNRLPFKMKQTTHKYAYLVIRVPSLLLKKSQKFSGLPKRFSKMLYNACALLNLLYMASSTANMLAQVHCKQRCNTRIHYVWNTKYF